MATNTNLSVFGRSSQLTYTTTVAGLTALLGTGQPVTNQFVLTAGTTHFTVQWVCSGAGNLHIQQSCNDPREVQDQNSASGIPQVWFEVGTASTFGAVQSYSSAGAIRMLRGYVDGAYASTDVVTITISTSILV